MCRDIVMAIRARHIRNMKLGIKKYELRKTRLGQCREYRVWLCESGTAGRIVAAFTSRAFPELTDLDDGRIADLACITRAEVAGYRKGGHQRLFGWLVEDFRYFGDTEQERHTAGFGLKRPPQSWCYARGGIEDG